MKKVIEEKNKKCSEQGKITRAAEKIGVARKAFKNKKSGGCFDK